MNQIKFPKIDFINTEKSLLVNSGIKICVQCGNLLVDNYEFGLSCENCGSFFVFDWKKMNKKELRKNE